jgi:hypothetical protein
VELLSGGIVKRLLSAAVLGLAATALSITPALAAPPEPAGGEGEDLSECGFTVHAELSGTFKLVEHAGFSLSVFPNTRVVLTNPDTGESVTFVISGVVRDTPTDTGITLRFSGHNLVVGPGIEGILYTTGTHTFVGTGGETLTLTESHGKVLNVCDVLAQ